MRALKMGIHASSFMRRGLIGYWPLNHGSGLTAFDRSGQGRNGTLNGANWGSDGYAQFDGLDDRITLPSPYTTEILSNSTKTMSIWAFLLGEEQGEGQRFFTFTFTTT